MDNLADVAVDDLQAALEAVEWKTPAQRLIAAIAYKRGVTQTELAAWFGVERKTIYNWLSRLDGTNLVESARDEPRPGRPRKLTEGQWTRLKATLSEPPDAVGYDRRVWRPRMVQAYVRDRFEVEYSLASCRRLIAQASGE